MHDLGSLVKAVETTHDRDDFFELEDLIPYKGSIIPISSQQVNRPVKIGRGAQVDGFIYGKVVEILDGFSSRKEDRTRTLSIFGRENVSIRDYCCIGGHVTSAGELTIGANSVVLGSVIAPNVLKIGQGTRIDGNLVSVGHVSIAENVHIGGYVIVLKGGVAIGRSSKVYDIITSGDVILDDGVIISDPIIWSKKGQIEVSSVNIGKKNFPLEPSISNLNMPGEMNSYWEAINTFDYDELFEELKLNLHRIGGSK